MPGDAAEAPTNVFTTVSSAAADTAALPEAAASLPEVHIVHQGDSLARLASRYLGDDARALEIFDLNRDVLDNPHVLPLGVELRIPQGDMPVDERQPAPAPN
jgi:nucleoid-associated protein YgaU